MKRSILVLIFLSLSAQSTFAGWENVSSKDFSVPPPPQIGSEVFKQDFIVLHYYQETRTQAQCQLGEEQRQAEWGSLYKHSRVLSPAEYNKVTPLMKKVVKFGSRVGAYMKSKNPRLRPYDADSTLEPCVERVTGKKSYPSTHATVGALSACVLAKIFPDRESELIQYGDFIGELRIIIGVHHPSDVRAGQELGGSICGRLLSERDFQREIQNLH